MAERTLGIYKVIILDPDAETTSTMTPDQIANHTIAMKAECALCEKLFFRHLDLVEKVKQDPGDHAARAELASLDPTKISERMLHALDELAKAGPVDLEKVSNVFNLYLAQIIANLDLEHIKVELCNLP